MKEGDLLRDIVYIALAAIFIVYLMQIAAAIACMADTQKDFLTFLQSYEAIEIQDVESETR